jgi:hypothetical protein
MTPRSRHHAIGRWLPPELSPTAILLIAIELRRCCAAHTVAHSSHLPPQEI